MKLDNGQVLYTIIEDYLVVIHNFLYHLIELENMGINTKYHFPTKIARRMDIIIPKWKD